MDRISLKLESKRLLSSHFPFFVILFLPVIILQFGNSFASSMIDIQSKAFQNSYAMLLEGDLNAGTENLLLIFAIMALLGIIISLLSAGMTFASIDLLRNKAKFDQPVTKSFTILNNGTYFISAIIMGILTTIMIFLWSLLLVIPGIIKSFSYVQALNIYRDALDAGKPIGYFEAITKSRQMMAGHKMEYFILALSFIGWYILEGLSFGVLSFWVLPYTQLAFANFYVKIADDSESEDLTSIFDHQA
ncbi:DUF975 family protein [Lentilactobacillus sp. TOM.63]|uniref:DUF975 family protein n=1 Tax=Lentilactobacillus TaxID=2767893 RepID=UPI001C27DD04|nr:MULTISPECIES: DUF975 family protein [Lentilactobacillus]MBU9789795.1 DUF975 family protein [Lentilactobacillus dabitei]MDM7517312.1 DUF975 family protein [Lentilactobacillus sp. TOM.63]